MGIEILPSLLIARIRRVKEKRIKSVFVFEEEGKVIVSVYLKKDQPMGRKSFNYFPLNDESVDDMFSGIMKTLEEVTRRADKTIEFNAEEEYDAGG